MKKIETLSEDVYHVLNSDYQHTTNEALNEAYALSKGTQCKQFMYSLSLNPPLDEKVSIQTLEETLDRVETQWRI